MATPELQATAYYVLREGTTEGPFTEEELRAGVTEGKLAPRDFVQIEGYPIWQPLSRVLGNEAPMEGPIAPSWRELAAWGWLRLRHNCDEQSLVAGAIFIGIGSLALALVLAQWGFVFWLPWFAAAAFAAIALLRRQRAEQGLLLLVGVITLPFLLFFIVPERVGSGTPPAQEIVAAESEPSADTVPQAVAVVPQLEAPSALPPAPLPDAPEPPPEIPPVVEARPVVAAASTPVAPAVAKPTAPSLPTIVSARPAQPPQKVEAVARPAGQPSAAAAAPAPAPADAAPATAGDLIQRHRDAFIVITGRDGSGSGFICRVAGTPYLFTNIHVVAGMAQPLFTRLDGTAVRPGAAAAAAGHDILRFEIADPVAQPLEAMSDPGNNIRLGDEVVVLGNSGGGGVVTSMKGEVVGVGPDRIEVSAEFIPGNSGSPIIHVRTGTVIGVATYLTSRYEQFSSNPSGSSAQGGSQRISGTGTLVVRRFGYRLDSVRQWEPVNWAVFRQEGEELRKISLLTEDVIDFLGALRERRTPSFATFTLRRPATEWFNVIRNKTTSDADRFRGTAGFLRTLRSMVRSDVAAAEARVRYSYFREELRKEREVRDRLYEAFDTEAKGMASPR